MFTATEPKAIWGGVKQTGIGRTHGPYGLLELVNIKYVSADFAAKKERVWWYPYSKNKLEMLQESCRLLHSPQAWQKIKALFRLASRMKTIRASLPWRSLLRVMARLFS